MCTISLLASLALSTLTLWSLPCIQSRLSWQGKRGPPSRTRRRVLWETHTCVAACFRTSSEAIHATLYVTMNRPMNRRNQSRFQAESCRSTFPQQHRYNPIHSWRLLWKKERKREKGVDNLIPFLKLKSERGGGVLNIWTQKKPKQCAWGWHENQAFYYLENKRLSGCY